MKYTLDEIIVTKKKHICGSDQWKVIRTGADLKLECLGCGRVIWISSFELDKRVKKKEI